MISEYLYRRPISEHRYRQPISEHRYRQPISEHRDDQPISEHRYRQPISEHRDYRPISEHRYRAPISEQIINSQPIIPISYFVRRKYQKHVSYIPVCMLNLHPPTLLISPPSSIPPSSASPTLSITQRNSLVVFLRSMLS